MKQEIKPATGRLGVLVVGVGGAVATTMIVGTLASRKGLAKPIGSITQLATMRMENNEEKLIKDVVPLTDLNDIVFGGWDIFPDNAYEAAMYAEVLKEKDLNGVKDELEAIKPMPAAFDHNWAKRLLHSSALRFEACLIAYTGACRSHFLLARTAIVNRFFPLVAHHHQLLLERSHIIISFFPSLLHKTKRCGDDN